MHSQFRGNVILQCNMSASTAAKTWLTVKAQAAGRTRRLGTSDIADERVAHHPLRIIR
jgi:hypothetical protein